VSLFDSSTGQEICEIAYLSTEDKKQGRVRQDLHIASQINKIETNSVYNMMVAGTEDCKIKFFDLKSNQLIKSVVGHADSISCLSPMVANHPNIMISAGHDGSVRIWDIRTFQLLHDVSANRRKYDEGTLAVSVCSQLQLLAAGGADSNIKMFALSF
jgi:WD40 repeat protein